MAEPRLLVPARTKEEAALTRWKALEAMRSGSEVLGVGYLRALSCCAFASVADRARADLAEWERKRGAA